MNKLFLFGLLLILHGHSVFGNEPDSAYVFSYATEKNNGGNGLHYAWSIDQKNWQSIGPEYRFLFCDFGNWGEQKRMISPFLFQDQEKEWHCLWSLNNKVGQFAHAKTTDLFTWDPQSYPQVMEDGNVLEPEVSWQALSNHYLITWLSVLNDDRKVYKTTTTDFKSYASTVEGTENDRINVRKEVPIEGVKQLGTISKVSWEIIDGLIQFHKLGQFKEIQRAERLTDDAFRFSDLESLDANIIVNPTDKKVISDLLIGVFFEDINYSADGGLYAELVQNRGFEYNPADKKFRDKDWNSFKAWRFTGEQSNFIVDTIEPIHPNQKHYVVLTVENQNEKLINEGFDGIPIMAGDKYNFSVFARGHNGTKGKLLIRLVDELGNVCAEAKTKNINANWKKYELVITATKSNDSTRLEIIPQFTGKVAFDMISLFPQLTFKGHKNGLRADLAQTIADMKPRFVRFPGGCVSHGDGLDNIYRWKNTIGPLESRVPSRNIWNYHQSMGLGYFEYFQFCEDIGAVPLPVIAAGVPCQNSSTGGYGQQCGIPMCDMDAYVQDILDLIEWANGDENSKWGKLRADAGHPKPFNLKYVGIGNEDLITDIFEERFTLIYKAINEKYPEITVVGTVGPFSEGTDYRVGWELATKLKVPMVDEHYYQPPGWYLNNQDYYDSYDRTKSKVYLGEYATHIPGRHLNIETALCDALHLINVERNADVVHMTSYAPLLAKKDHTQWNPDLVYFSNTEIFLTTDYYVQKLFGQNSGNVYIAGTVQIADNREDIKKRVAMSVVQDIKSKDVIVKLVNLLPAEVNAGIDLSGLNINESEAELTVLKGNPEDKSAKPMLSKLNVSENFDYILPAYSLSIIRIKTNN